MIVRRSLLIVAAVATAALIAGCGGSSSSSSSSSSTSEGSSAKPADGKQVFVDAGCGGCHTLQAAGTDGKVGPVLNDVKLSKLAVAGKVRSGGGGMPSFASKLSPEEIDAVSEFVAESDGS